MTLHCLVDSHRSPGKSIPTPQPHGQVTSRGAPAGQAEVSKVHAGRCALGIVQTGLQVRIYPFDVKVSIPAVFESRGLWQDMCHRWIHKACSRASNLR